MRIAYLTQPYPPMISGASIAAEQLANRMAERGHDVLVIAASETGEPHIVVNKNLSVLRLRSINNPLRVDQRSSFFQGKTIMKALAEFQPDLIHIHEPLEVGRYGIKYAKVSGIPTVLTIHLMPWYFSCYLQDNPVFFQFIETIAWNYSRWILKKFDRVICPTQLVAQTVRIWTGKSSSVIHNGIDLESFRPKGKEEDHSWVRERFNIPPDAPIILHVGRLDAEKSVDRVILAAAEAIKKTNAHLLLVGDGKEKPALISLCKSLNIDSRSHFTGFVSGKDELIKVYQAATLFAFASEVETQGIVLLEAAACGLPIAAVDSTSIPEIVHHGRNGFLSAPADIAGLSRSIETLLNDAELCCRMGQESLAVAGKFDIHATISEHEKLYETMLAQQFQRVPVKTRRTAKASFHIRM